MTLIEQIQLNLHENQVKHSGTTYTQTFPVEYIELDKFNNAGNSRLARSLFSGTVQRLLDYLSTAELSPELHFKFKTYAPNGDQERRRQVKVFMRRVNKICQGLGKTPLEPVNRVVEGHTFPEHWIVYLK